MFCTASSTFFFFLTVFSPRLLWRWVKCSTLLSLSVSLSIARYENAAKTSLFSLFSPPPPPLTRASADIYWSFEPLRRLSDTLFSPTFFFLYGSDRSGVCACSPVCGCCWTGLSLHNETSSLSYLQEYRYVLVFNRWSGHICADNKKKRKKAARRVPLVELVQPRGLEPFVPPCLSISRRVLILRPLRCPPPGQLPIRRVSDRL